MTKGNNTHEVNIPSAYDSFPDSFLIDSRDVLQIMGYRHKSSITYAIRAGSIPDRVGTQDCCFNKYGSKKQLFRLGDFRKLKEYRNLGLTYKEGLEQDDWESYDNDFRE